MTDYQHVTVLLKESVDMLLDGRKTGIYIDATLGGGGTSREILERLDETGRVIGIDQDSIALESTARKLESYPNFTTLRANFRDMADRLKEIDVVSVDGVIMDIGLSSIQLDDPERGFSFRYDAPLDMRMDKDGGGESAFDLLQSLDEVELKRIFRDFGEERWAGRIASRIVERRQRKEPVRTTAELAQLVDRAIPKRFQSRRIHPATRVFQALRIAVNDELGALEEGLHAGISLLNEGGRILVISYHSLEDRIVKHTFRHYAREEKILRLITKKPMTPDDEEVENNPRARSAKLRLAEKI